MDIKSRKLIYKHKKFGGIVLDAVLNCLLAFVVLFMLVVICFSMSHPYYDVRGTSMEPNIRQASGDYVGQGCFVETSKNFDYGDVVVANSNSNRKVVKRVIAMAGDKIGYFKNSQNFYELVLLKSGETTAKIIDENYLFAKVAVSDINHTKAKNETSYNNFVANLGEDLEDFEFNSQTIKMLTILDNQIFLLGDNRETSIDCATYGPLNTSAVDGKVVLVVMQNDFHLWDIFKYCFLS